MIDIILPLQLILFQVLFLLVAIVLEARVFHRRLKLTRKTSVQYATSLNLWSVVIGWISFLFIEPLLPNTLQNEIVSFIFFNHPIGSELDEANFQILITGIIIFSFAFIVKLLGFSFIKNWIHDNPEPFNGSSDLSNKRPSVLNPYKRKITKPKPNPAFALLLANAYSYSAILLILVLRFLEFNTVL